MESRPDLPIVRSLETFITATPALGHVRKTTSPDGEFVSPLLAFALAQAHSLEPLRQHVETLWNQRSWTEKAKNAKELALAHLQEFGEIRFGPGCLSTMFTNLLGAMEKRGYLVTRGQFLEQLRALVPPENKPSRIGVFGITTRNRPDGLRKSLLSYLGNFEKFGRTPRVLVADVSTTEAYRQANLLAVQEAQDCFGRKVEYLGLEARQRLVDEASGNSERKKAVEFCLFGVPGIGHTYGLSRNLLLAATRGELVFSVDDDTVCRTFRPGAFKNEISFPSGPSTTAPQTVLHFNSREAARASLVEEDFDVLAAHETVLGKTQGQALLSHLEAGPASGIHRLDGLSYNDIALNRNPILLTFNSLVGDSGSGAGMPFLRDRWQGEPEAGDSEFQLAEARGREITKTVNQIHVSAPGPCMTIFYGFDNRSALPPFFPHFRMEDMLFKDMLTKIRPDGKSAYLPLTLEHSPVQGRTNPSMISLQNFGYSMHDLIFAIMRDSTIVVGPSEDFSIGREKIADAIVRFVEQPFTSYKRRLNEILLRYKLLELAEKKALFREKKAKLPREVAEEAEAAFRWTERKLAVSPPIADVSMVKSEGDARHCEEASRQMILQMAAALRYF